MERQVTFLTHVLLGGIGGAVNAAMLGKLRGRDRGAPLAILLGVAAGIYVGYGLQDGRPSQAVLQLVGAFPFVVVATRWPQAVGLLGVAWLTHGLWDGLHELRVVNTSVPSWYAGACLGWDIVLGAAAVLWGRTLRHREAETS